jgi:2'-5' RNA ligase
VRLFVAVWPPPEVQAVLAELPRPVDPRVRWTTSPQWHVTLAFLGEVADDRVPALSTRLVELGWGWSAPVVARLGPATTLLSAQILCAPVDGLDLVARHVAAAVGRFADRATVGGPPFVGHLTLARARGRHRLGAGLAGTPVESRWAVDDLWLVRAELDPAGARYETLVAAPLSRRDPGESG